MEMIVEHIKYKNIKYKIYKHINIKYIFVGRPTSLRIDGCKSVQSITILLFSVATHDFII
jgi:hypothetical protein